jgi:hypothetical protein
VLLRPDGDGVIAIGQASHAWVSGQLARSWQPPPAPFEEVCLAAEQHDIGMAEWDLNPTLNHDTGLPTSFMELPVATHIALWTAAPGKVMSQSRYAALLVSMHGTALQGLRDLSRLSAGDRELVTEYLKGQRAVQAELAEQLHVDREQLGRNQRLIWAWDSFSLALCLRWSKVSEAGHVLTLGDAGFTMSPWPFATDELSVRCEGRRLVGRFATGPELGAALERAPVVRLQFTMRAA